MAYFKNVDTLQELRKQYKDLLKQYHPDNPNGSTAATQAINAEYDSLFKALKNKYGKTADSKAADNATDFNSMKYDFAEDEKLREILNKVIRFTDITIEIIGNWLWISGNTYQYRKELKDLNFKFARQKKMWYWHSEAFRKRSHKTLSIEAIRVYYGSTKVETEQVKQLKQA